MIFQVCLRKTQMLQLMIKKMVNYSFVSLTIWSSFCYVLLVFYVCWQLFGLFFCRSDLFRFTLWEILIGTIIFTLNEKNGSFFFWKLWNHNFFLKTDILNLIFWLYLIIISCYFIGYNFFLGKYSLLIEIDDLFRIWACLWFILIPNSCI